MRTCPECSNAVEDNAIFCDNCGLQLSSVDDQAAFSGGELASPAGQRPIGPSQHSAGRVQPGTCSACGYGNVPGEMFCQNCGVQLAPVASVPPPGPTPIVASPSDEGLSSAAQSQTCPTCGQVNVPWEMFCMNCGMQLARKEKVDSPGSHADGVCSGCGYTNAATNAFCENCGEQLAGEAALADKPVSVEQSLEADVFCSHCGQPRSPGEKYCDNCGLQYPSYDPAFVQASPQIHPAMEPREEAVPQGASPQEVCPNCGYTHKPGEDYCDSCGYQYALQEPSALSSKPSVDRGSDDDRTYVTGKLVVRSTQAVIPLPAGKTELLLGRTDPVREIFPDVDLADYGGDKHGVSRSHARLSQSGPQLLLEDLNSTNFTFLNQRKLEPGQRYPLNDGDEIRLGLLIMEYRTG